MERLQVAATRLDNQVNARDVDGTYAQSASAKKVPPQITALPEVEEGIARLNDRLVAVDVGIDRLIEALYGPSPEDGCIRADGPEHFAPGAVPRLIERCSQAHLRISQIENGVQRLLAIVGA